ncbi:hypothetical protein ONS95_010571 [Cadophora gregata]|uniref:uncharacterized protein n=1 Tax=Cadophora gregata TaxID=51156 RepID=UPI0026DC62EF|nr:uncharacterized protein ONS95_010571 [Cadophora gregata]KAK0122329.1 hypothetical protein ONS95_010571 [Cadophora gregata]
MSETQDPTEMASTIDNDESDSDSDISMSAETDDEEDNDRLRSIIVVNPDPAVATPDHAENTSKKRKFSESSGHSNKQPRNGMIDEVRKRLKPDDAVQNHWIEGKLRKDKSLLPAEIWHHIFTFCPAISLCRLMRVNRTFNMYLDPVPYPPLVPLSKSALWLLSPDNIWRCSRQFINIHGLPTPLLGKSELEMWRMACGSLCQFCGKARQPNLVVDQWHPGPGEKGVVPVWAFGIRTCGPCLLKYSIKEIDLLLSSTIPSPLMAALPFIFLTNELHVLSSAALQTGQHPSSLQITKHFYNFQVEEIKKEFEDVKAMGTATAEEWLKGLEGRGRERRNDATRWEKWESSGGVARMLALGKQTPKPTNTVSAPPTSTLTRPTNGTLPPHPGNNPLFASNQPSQPPVPTQNGFATNPPPRFDSPAQNGFAQYAPRPLLPTKHERTKEEVAELKAARRAEIERRCLLLDPPITAGVLAHMPSFQAAIQIIQPLVDSSWEVLKPRLISQRDDAEQRENDRLAQTRVVQERFDERRFQDVQSRSVSKDLAEREWDDMQAPLRARIGGYADEILRDGWNGGDKVSYETSPLFAAEVLIYVRKRFYAEVAKDEAAIRATGREPELDPPNGPFTRKLILENMKWVFDTKIKPYTEPYRKELFLCSACEYANKYYGFEGVIQHFAAKHTSALSVGSVVVHWKSEWPEYPPFNPDPDNTVKPYYPAAQSTTVPYSNSGPTTQQNYGYGGYPVPVSTPIPGPNPHVYQESPGPYYGHPQFGDQYSGPQNGPYAPPPQPYQDPSQGFQPQQYSVAPHAPTIAGYNDTPQDYPQTGYGASGPPYQPPQDVYANQGQQYPPPASEMSAQQASYHPSTQYGSVYNQAPSFPPSNLPPPQKTEQYIAQLQDLARNARDIWNSIGSIKEVPGSLKVYTIIYHVLKRFRENYQEDPPLSMMVEGLSSNKDMRPVRNVNGLLCKACTLGMAGSLSGPQKKHYSFPQLVNHFHTTHDLGLSQNYSSPLDWTRDMVDLPDMAKLAAVVNAPGMDDQKLTLFTEAVPEIIPAPQSSSSGFHHEAHQQYGPYTPQFDHPKLAPSQDNHDKYYAVMDNEKPLDSTSATFDSEEYDPRRPSDLPVDPRPLPKSTRRDRRPRKQSGAQDVLPGYQYDERYEDRAPEEPYNGRPERLYSDRRTSPSRMIPAAEYGHVVVREEQQLSGRRIQYQEMPANFEYRVRRNPVPAYNNTETVHSESQHRTANSRSYHLNGHAQPPVVMYESEARDRPRSIDEATAQQSRIYEVVAQISQQAQQARDQHSAKEDLADAGSEDGEVQAEQELKAPAPSLLPLDEASNAAQRFLDNFRPGETLSEVSVTKASEHDSDARMYRVPVESQHRPRAEYEGDDRSFVSTRRPVNPELDDTPPHGYIIHDRLPVSRPTQAYAYEERYVGSVSEQGGPRDRSPELVDRRYKLNNVVYRDERQDSQGNYRTPSRYARYESVRLENDRARSRSPVYVKVGTHAGHYRELSPGPHPAHSLRQEPIYRSRTPLQGVDERELKRAPRQEYYRVYADEPRPREPQYAEAFEYVRVSDPAGDYMIRRPVRREPEPIYATYEDDVYARQPVYESRAPAPRAAEPTFYEEEYDPRHPAPPPPPARQVRYQ